MAAAEEVQFSIKVMAMKGSNKVIYAEVDCDFADVLFSFLTLPLGTVMRLLVQHYGDNTPTVGSLNSLHAGLLNLDSGHFWTKEGQQMLMIPRNSSGIECSRLKLQIDDIPPIQYFMCGFEACVSMFYGAKCPCSTTNTMRRKDVEDIAQTGGRRVFTVHRASFLLTDDLCVMMNTSTSLFRILKLNGIEDTSVLEERTLIFGLKEVMELLKGSLVSETPITDIVFSNSSVDTTRKRRKEFPSSAKYEPNAFPQADQTSENMSSDSKKITVKVVVQKSTNRILLAQSRQDFADFLFSFLTIPLGGVQSLLRNNACLWSINNLYRSISDLEIGAYMKSRETNTKLLEPQIPPFHLSNHQIFPLSQQKPPVIHKRTIDGSTRSFVLTTSGIGFAEMKMIDPRGRNSFGKGPSTFMVTDDLKVKTPSSKLIVSTLNQMQIPLSDVEEQDLDIGMEEALSILKASLTSTCALSEGLKPFLKRQPKQEK